MSDTRRQIDIDLEQAFRIMQSAQHPRTWTHGQGPSMHAESLAAAPRWLQKWDQDKRWMIQFSMDYEGWLVFANAFGLSKENVWDIMEVYKNDWPDETERLDEFNQRFDLNLTLEESGYKNFQLSNGDTHIIYGSFQEVRDRIVQIVDALEKSGGVVFETIESHDDMDLLKNLVTDTYTWGKCPEGEPEKTKYSGNFRNKHLAIKAKDKNELIIWE